MSLLKKMIAEAIGTFVLVFFACGVAALTGGELVATALTFGLVIVAMAYSIGRISGCHINPAVSMGCVLDGRMSWKEFGAYVGAQFVGGFVGALAIFGLGKEVLVGNACNGVIGGTLSAGSVIGSFVVEVVLTAVFVYVILNVTDAKNDGAGKKAGLIIGLTLTLVHLLGIGLTGTSVNPARSLATALGAVVYQLNGWENAIGQVWIFILAPMAGGALAALMFKLLHKEAK